MNFSKPPHTTRARATRALIELHNGEQPTRKGAPDTDALYLLKFEGLIKLDCETHKLVITTKGQKHISLLGFDLYPSLAQTNPA